MDRIGGSVEDAQSHADADNYLTFGEEAGWDADDMLASNLGWAKTWIGRMPLGSLHSIIFQSFLRCWHQPAVEAAAVRLWVLRCDELRGEPVL